MMEENQKVQKNTHRKPRQKKTAEDKVLAKTVSEAVVEKSTHNIHNIKSDAQAPEETVFSGGIVLALALLVGLLFYNQLQLFELSSFVTTGVNPISSFIAPQTSGGTITLSDSDKVAYGPVLLAAGEQPAISGYRTKVKELPTISGTAKKEKTGNPTQDIINKVIPTGIPEYGKDAGVSFDDPVGGLNKLGQLEQTVTLTPQQQQRWEKIVNAYTCDFCCGSPQNPTIISRCGCAHAAGWRGLAKFLIAKYDDKVSNEQVMGEMTKWKTIWYPGPIVQRIVQENTLSGGNANGAPVQLDALPQMVGGC